MLPSSDSFLVEAALLSLSFPCVLLVADFEKGEKEVKEVSCGSTTTFYCLTI